MKSSLSRIRQEHIICDCWDYIMGKFSLIFIKRWIPEILKLGTRLTQFGWKKLTESQGRAQPREKSQEVQLFLTFWTCKTKNEF